MVQKSGDKTSWCLENYGCFSFNVRVFIHHRWCMQDFWTSNSRVLILICFWNVKTFPSSSHVEHPPKVVKFFKIFLRSKKVLLFFSKSCNFHMKPSIVFFGWTIFDVSLPRCVQKPPFFPFFFRPRFWLAGDLHAGQFGRAPERHRAAEEAQRRWEVLSLSSSWWIFLQGKLLVVGGNSTQFSKKS